MSDERAPPKGLRLSQLEHGGDDLLVLSFPSPRRRLPEGLTPAEIEVALMVRHGLSNAEIAAARGVSVRTVANQLQALFRKLGVGSRIELARKVGG
ncbi:MAG: helix-turn-helix transcriptional regulator [Polyangiaceae bacterium]|nr:helix-turn-helix transcriptional regulator [Polyangiaceae bacterium]